MTDTVVIGGGIVGSSAAYHLARSGVQVTLIDRTDQGQATAAGAGIIAPATGFKPPPDFGALPAACAAYYPHLIQQLAEDGETDTGYEVVGSLIVATNEEEADLLDGLKHLALERRGNGTQGIDEVTHLTSSEARGLFPPLADNFGALHVSGSARVDGRLMRDCLQRAAQKRGATIIHGDAQPILQGDRVVHVEVDGRKLSTEALIMAGGAWSRALAEGMGISITIYPQRGQILHLDLPEVETTRWPIVSGFHSHYLLTFPTHRVVAGATREDRTGYDYRITAAGVHEATSEALRVAPGLATATLIEVRIGFRPASPDRLPILGRVPNLRSVYVATGHGASGLQLGPYSAAAVADLAQGKSPAIDLTAFSPERFQRT